MNVERAAYNSLYRLSILLRDLRGLSQMRALTKPVPSDVNVEPSNLCNADCVFCGYQFQERLHQEIPIDVASEIIAAAKRAGVKRLGLTPVVGEPLVNRRIEELIRIAAAPPQALNTGLTTNGILLTPARYQSLVEAGLTSICISMTYPDEEEYFRIYRNKGLNKIVANLEGILDIFSNRSCDISLSIRTPRRRWRGHPLFVRARTAGWHIDRNRFYDDWSGRTAPIMEAEGLWTRPNRPKILPCSMLYSGPHFFSDGRSTACGCRDLDGKSELRLDSKELLCDMGKVYRTGAVEELRERFRNSDAPAICMSCRHYNPQFEGESRRNRFRQAIGDFAVLLRMHPIA